MTLDRRTLIAAAKNETVYIVYLEWPEGAGGGTCYDNQAEAVDAAQKLAEKWRNHCCEVRLLKRSKKFINFKEKP